MPFSTDLESRLLDVFPVQAAITDATGRIVRANRLWNPFGDQNSLSDPNSWVGQNYLEECDRASQRGVRGATAVARGLRRILDGTAEIFKMRYERQGPTGYRWFQIVAVPLGGIPVEGMLILHINVTHERMLAQRFHRRTEYRNHRVVVCAWCRRIRNRDEWTTLEDYFTNRYAFAFSHGICPECQHAFRA